MESESIREFDSFLKNGLVVFFKELMLGRDAESVVFKRALGVLVELPNELLIYILNILNHQVLWVYTNWSSEIWLVFLLSVLFIKIQHFVQWLQNCVIFDRERLLDLNHHVHFRGVWFVYQGQNDVFSWFKCVSRFINLRRDNFNSILNGKCRLKVYNSNTLHLQNYL